jgi:hypothetical protein
MKDALPAGWEFDPREVALLERACAQADDLDRLEKAIKRDGVVATGSQGQRIVSGLVGEARQARIALARLLGEISLPVESDEKPRTARSLRAKKAADTRWDSHRRRQGVAVG